MGYLADTSLSQPIMKGNWVRHSRRELRDQKATTIVHFQIFPALCGRTHVILRPCGLSTSMREQLQSTTTGGKGGQEGGAHLLMLALRHLYPDVHKAKSTSRFSSVLFSLALAE